MIENGVIALKIFEWVMIALYALIGAISLYRTRDKKEIDVISYWLIYVALVIVLLDRAIQ